MSFFSEFTHPGGQRRTEETTYRSQYPNTGGAPQVPRPWIAEWDQRDQRWIFINERTGERTFQHPGGSYERREEYYQPGPGRQGGGYYEERREEHRGGGHGMAYGVAGAAAGLAGGALLMHEGHKIGMY